MVDISYSKSARRSADAIPETAVSLLRDESTSLIPDTVPKTERQIEPCVAAKAAVTAHVGQQFSMSFAIVNVLIS